MHQGSCCECGKQVTFRRAIDKRCPDCAARRRVTGSAGRASTARHQKKKWARKSTEAIRARPFVGIDGEGINVNVCSPDGTITREHWYVYMAAVAYDGEHFTTYELWHGGYPLGTNDILWWMYRLPRGSWWFYSAGYDWTKIFTTIAMTDRPTLRAIYPSTREALTSDVFKPVPWRGWYITKVQGAVTFGRKFKGRLVERFVADGFKCWGGGSFVDKLTEWNIGTEEEREKMRAMKDQRSTFGECTPEVRAYCVDECTKLAELARTITTTAAAKDIRPRRWYSAGSAAKAMLNVHGAAAFRGPDRFAGAPESWHELLMRTFFGGWFESAGAGVFSVLHGFDLASAYPAIIVELPCLAHGHWEPGRVAGAVCFGHVSWRYRLDSGARFGPLPWRQTDQRISHPLDGEGWYYEAEIVAAQGLPWYDWTEHEWVSFVPGCDHKPFSWIAQVYADRIALGKDGAGLVLKVSLNSVYGTFADMIALDAKYASVIWASMITASTRAKILEVIARYPDQVVMIATDGILTLDKIAIESPVPKTLGGWDYEGTMRDVLVVQPGLVLAAEGQKKPKTRGHSWRDITERSDQLRAAWDRKGWDATLNYPRSRFIPARQAMARKNFAGTYGQWSTVPTKIFFRPTTRFPHPKLIDGHRWSLPFGVGTGLSAPYDKLLALEIIQREQIQNEDEIEDAQP